MFPASVEAAEAAEREAAAELRRLGELAFLRRAAAWLQARPLLGIDVFGRGRAETDMPVQAGYVALMEACLVALRGRGKGSRRRRPSTGRAGPRCGALPTRSTAPRRCSPSIRTVAR